MMPDYAFADSEEDMDFVEYQGMYDLACVEVIKLILPSFLSDVNFNPADDSSMFVLAPDAPQLDQGMSHFSKLISTSQNPD
jgi:hypothetical protein